LPIVPRRLILKEVSNELSLYASKLQNRRLHLQELIAKRDRLDYEIRKLKKAIKDDKKVSTKRGKPLEEEAKIVLESLNQSGYHNLFPDDLEELKSIRSCLEIIASEERLIDFQEKYESERYWK